MVRKEDLVSLDVTMPENDEEVGNIGYCFMSSDVKTCVKNWRPSSYTSISKVCNCSSNTTGSAWLSGNGTNLL